MSAPKICQCGRKIRIVVKTQGKKRSRAARRGQAVALKGHDLCGVCWDELVKRAAAATS